MMNNHGRLVETKQFKRGMKDERTEHPWMSKQMRELLVTDHITLHPYMYKNEK